MPDLATLQSQLADVRASIRAIETHAQEYALDGGALSLKRADLETLYARERELEKKIARAGRGGMRMVQGVAV